MSLPPLRRVLTVGWCLPACTVLACAQTDTLSLQAAIDTAEARNLSIAAAQAAINRSTSRLHETGATRLPALSFRTHLLYAPVPGYNEIVTNNGEYGAQFQAALPLYDGGLRGTLADQASNDVERSQTTLRKARIDIAYGVRVSYYEVLRAQGEATIRTASVERLRQYALFLAGLQRGGIASQSDVLKSRVDLNNETIALENAERSVEQAKTELNSVLGIPMSARVDVTPLLPDDSVTVPGFIVEENADYQLLKHDEASASYDIDIAKSERYPTFSVEGDAGVLGVKPKEFHQDKGYSVLLDIELPLYTWGAIGDRIEQKEFAAEQIRTQADLARREIETQWRIATGDLDQARRNLAAYAANARDAEQNYLSARSRFAGGAGSNLEVLEAHRLMVETMLNENSTLFQIRSLEANLLRLAGRQQ